MFFRNALLAFPGFEPTISAGERPQNYALDRAATGIDMNEEIVYNEVITCT